MTDKKKENCSVSSETCQAHRAGIDQRFEDFGKLIDEKIKGIKTSIIVASSVSTLIIMVVQFILSLQH